MKQDTPIFIAGAGPVGLAAALELSRRGQHCAIIDRDGVPTPESRALAINARTLDLLAPSGVTEALLARAHRIHRVTIREGGRERIHIELRHMPHRFNFLSVLAQAETEKILIAALAARGVPVQWNTELSSLVPEGDGFLCNGQRHDTVIGADGARSFVRKSLGIGFAGESTPQVFSLADVELEDWPFPFDMSVASFYPGHIVAFVPMGEGHGRFIGSNPDVAKLFPPEAKVKRVIWQSEFRINYRQAEAYQKGNAFLAGDAAHIHSPVGGRGMNLGIEDACWLAWLIAEGRTAEYTALRHHAGAQILAQTRTLTNFVANRGTVATALLRHVMPWALAIAPLRRAMLGRLAGQDTPAAPWISA